MPPLLFFLYPCHSSGEEEEEEGKEREGKFSRAESLVERMHSKLEGGKEEEKPKILFFFSRFDNVLVEGGLLLH